ncbi:MAG: PilZ domain-containing protein [Candidatus Omnitrophota bacterium]
MEKKEKRKFTRLKAHHLVKYKVVDSDKKLSFVKNISAGGLLFYASKSIPADSIVELDVNFPVYKRPIKVTCRVVRVKPLKRIPGFDVAVEFVDIDKEAQGFINRKILKVQEGLKHENQKT